ncbi:glycosyltransferase family 39 protein [Leptolyngbya sp. 7M]|uniref:glycosyltransferase family 39 protein n=1 Tax=Leptolyngbya sp. 7M TaxID=2812896 RepID=UPI001B8AC6D0|nr:glycosyltransferase family 39 protein [Leptolyngbya sp. 7M]QYO63904.1 glycosyltransferase family 39 protein [Leptolyngbya sp. 7M]
MTAPELQFFQQIKPGSTTADTIHSLMAEDPQHPPLYFVMARYWMQQFGSSIAASRLLPALISLLGLPLMYGLAMELFASSSTALLATAFLALSPFDILFAQTARQYSLLTIVILGSSWLLLRAMRQSTARRWAGYGLSVALGLYTHPFFALTLLAHAGYVLGMSAISARAVDLGWSWQVVAKGVKDRRMWGFGLSVLAALLVYSPWIWVLLHQHQRANATTDWTRAEVGLPYLLKLWTLSFTSLFIDLDFGFDNPLTFLVRLPFVVLILLALYRVYRHTPARTWLFIFTTVFVPFLLLAIPDLILGGKRSAVSRYLISCFPGIQLAVAYLLSYKVLATRGGANNLWRAVLVLCLASSVLSASISAASESWWSKDLSYSNAEIIHLVNATADQNPVMLSDMGDDYTNMGDLVSLSYGLQPNVRLFLVSATPDLTPLAQESNVFVFRASQSLEAAIKQQGWQLTPVSDRARLWRIAQGLSRSSIERKISETS